MKIPYISGEWKVLFRPEKNGNYCNDHTVVTGADRKWHFYGITSMSGHSYDERYFVHGVGNSLEEPFEEVGRSIDRGTLAWSPCVIEKDGIYYMFYGPSPTSLAVSFEMYEWFGTNIHIENEPLMAVHRDHFILKVSEDRYLMYACGIYDKKGAVSILSSEDLLNWKFEGFALTTGDNAPLKPGWGACESPYVVEKDGLYYLFITYTDCADENYCYTLVFCSPDPMSFGCYDGEAGQQPVTVLQAHAPEILQENGNWYITTCGWLDKPNPNPGTVSIARLDWKD